MTENNTAYLEARETMKRVLRMPEAERKTVLDMIRGAIVISDLYAAQTAQVWQAEERIVCNKQGR